MTANLLTLNSSKTEFLLIGLKKQLNEIHNSSLNTTHSARKPWLHLWWTSYLLRPNFSHLQSLLLPYQTASLYSSLPWFHHSLHHCHLHRSLQTRLL